MRRATAGLKRLTVALTCLALVAFAVVTGAHHAAAARQPGAASLSATAAAAPDTGAPGRCPILKCATFLPASTPSIPQASTFGTGRYVATVEPAPAGRRSTEEPPPPRAT